MKTNIGSLNEGELHKSLKELHTEDGDDIECPVDGYIVDIKKEDRIVEIQTSNFHRVVPKMYDLLRNHTLHLVYPIAARTTITKTLKDGTVQQRKSPKRGTIYEIFAALVSAPSIVSHPKFSLEVPMIHEEQLREFDGKRGWRNRHWVVVGRKLIEPLDTYWFTNAGDLWSLFAEHVQTQFTTKEVAQSVQITRRLAQQALYCLRSCGAITTVGKKGNEIIYQEESVD